MMAGLRVPPEEIGQALSEVISGASVRRHFPLELARARGVYKHSCVKALHVHLLGRKAVYDDQGRLLMEEIKPSPAVAMFQAKTVLGQRETVRLEHSMSPEAIATLSADDLDALERLLAKVAAAESGIDPAGERTTLN